MRTYSEVRRRPRVQTVNDEPSMTQQSDLHRSDIHRVVGQYVKTGLFPSMAQVDLEYRDVSEFEDFADLMRQAQVAEREFMRLPSKVREVFDHDVMNWLDCAHDKDKFEAVRPRLEELGAIKKVEAAVPPPEPPPASPGAA